jgi:hypothetical protein
VNVASLEDAASDVGLIGVSAPEPLDGRRLVAESLQERVGKTLRVERLLRQSGNSFFDLNGIHGKLGFIKIWEKLYIEVLGRRVERNECRIRQFTPRVCQSWQDIYWGMRFFSEKENRRDGAHHGGCSTLLLRVRLPFLPPNAKTPMRP